MKIDPVGLTIGMPTRGMKVGFEWALNLAVQNYPINVQRIIQVKRCTLGYGRNESMNGNTSKEVSVDEGRNLICKQALKNKSKYIYFWDDDVAPPPNATRLLMYDLEQDDDLGIAAGIYTTKEDPPSPIVFQGDGNGSFWNWKAGDRFECTGIGTGAMMIRAEILEKLPEPWFKTLDLDSPPVGYSMLRQTDDLYFCDKVRAAGYKIMADANVLCVHWDYSVDPPKPYYLPPDSKPMKGVVIQPTMQGSL